MGRKNARRGLVVAQLVLSTCLAVLTAVSCGSRTGLPGADGTSDSGLDGPFSPDAPDRLPGIDVSRPDVPVIDPCPDAAATLIYVIGYSNTLYSFDPMAGTFTPIGPISCPGAAGDTPFSMAVDREGTAFVVFSDGSGNATALYRVSLRTAACTKTAYDPAANMNETFGMGFVANVSDAGDAGDQLFVAFDQQMINANGDLATLDTTTFKTRHIGRFSPPVDGSELTGTGDGHLFAFSPFHATRLNPTGPSFIDEIEPNTANVMATDTVPGIEQGLGWAFGFWRGAFYMFTTPGTSPSVVDGTTVVHKWDPVTKIVSLVATAPSGETIVGAGVSTCALLH